MIERSCGAYLVYYVGRWPVADTPSKLPTLATSCRLPLGPNTTILRFTMRGRLRLEPMKHGIPRLIVYDIYVCLGSPCRGRQAPVGTQQTLID